MSNHDDVPAPIDGVAVADGYRAAAARRGGVGFNDLRNRRFRIGFYYAAWGSAGIMSTTSAPSLSVNSGHVMLYFLLLIAGVMLLLLTTAAANLPWMEGAAARLEGILARMIKIDF